MPITFAIITTVATILGLNMNVTNIINQSKERDGTIRMLATQHAIAMEALDEIDSRVNKPIDTFLPMETDYLGIDSRTRRFLANLEDYRNYNIEIDNLYMSFRNYVDNISRYDSLFINDFASSVFTVHHASISSIINLIYANLKILIDIAKERRVVLFITCERKKSPEQFLLELYIHTLLMEARGSLMVEFIEVLLEGNDTVKYQCTKYEDEAMQRIYNLHQRIVIASKQDLSQLYECDTRTNFIGDNYAEFVSMIYGLAVRINRLPRGIYCEDYGDNVLSSLPTSMECNIRVPEIARRACRSRLVCEFEKHTVVKMCLSTITARKKFESITFSNTVDKPCAEGIQEFTFERTDDCYLCSCLCYGNPHEQRIDTTGSMSAIPQNRVVSGLRFRKLGNILALEIHESRINEEGYLEKDSGRWKGAFVTNTIDVPSMHFYWQFSSFQPVEGMLVTGVRMVLDHAPGGLFGGVEVNLCKFNRVTKKLEGPGSWIEQNRIKSYFPRCFRTPSRTPPAASYVTPSFDTDGCVKFGPTAFDYDVSQTFLPVFDTREVVSSTPLKSIGIVYKGDSDKRSQYLAPVLYSWINIEMAKVDNNVTLRLKDVKKSTGVRICFNSKHFIAITLVYKVL